MNATRNTGDFAVERFAIARKRRGLKGKELARRAGVSEVTVSRIAKMRNGPKLETVEALARALDYPVDFFFRDQIETLDVDEVSFRSMSGMRASERESAIAAGSIGLLLSDWVEARFDLPPADVPDLRNEDPEQAAVTLRCAWKLGERPLSRTLKLLESKGVRVFSLSEQTRRVDAFSFWRGDRPYMFLNMVKTAEHTVFDEAHELGHLVLHRHRSLADTLTDLEQEANSFAAAFLMPRRDVLANLPRRLDARAIVRAKSRWSVSAMALARRCYTLERLTEWQYRTVCIELSRMGYRSGEPNGIAREPSVVWNKVFRALWSERLTKEDVAKELAVPLDEIESLVFGLLKPPEDASRRDGGTDGLRVV